MNESQKLPRASAIYEGSVRHRRFTPKQNNFEYQVFMVYLDLQEINAIFDQSPWWSTSSFNAAQFKREDYLDGNSDYPLYDAVADLVEQRTGERPQGPIRMLTNLRYFGFIINPITCYYCFDVTGQCLQTVVAEVTNTPWKQRIQYVLSVDNGHQNKSKHEFEFAKEMHVSPFQPMDLQYHWRGKVPGQDLLIHIDVTKESQTVLDATMVLKRHAFVRSTMHRVLRRYPWMTAKVFAGIHWQAFKLFLKRIPYFSNPSRQQLTNKPTNPSVNS